MTIMLTVPPIHPSTGASGSGVRAITEGEHAVVKESGFLGTVANSFSDAFSGLTDSVQDYAKRYIDFEAIKRFGGVEGSVDSNGDPYYQPAGGGGAVAMESSNKTLLMVGAAGLGLFAIVMMVKK